jgi:hypothetical protein
VNATVQAPDIEKVTSDHLRAHPDVSAIVGRRVVGKTPESTDQPWVRVLKVDGPGDILDHLVRFMVQFDCYAGSKQGTDGGQPEAIRLGLAIRAALRDMIGVRGDAVVTGVSVVGDSRVPDPDLDTPARERVVLTTYVWAHS